MVAAPVPANDSERLASLRALQILDTPPEERFDRIVRLAVDVLDAPIAYVALVDARRQWFKAKVGIDVCETRRDISFCGHAILSDEPLVIEDARADERFADNPLVTGDPYVRFYAGHPLSAEDGHNVGTFCIVDRRPRGFTAKQMRVFRALAAMARREIGLVDVIRMQHALLTTKDQLLASQARLNQELAEAAAYVRSLLPQRLSSSPRTDWAYVTSSALGGDLFGYHWLDATRLAIYMLDVMGHGVGAALMSASVHTLLRHGGLPGVPMHRPDAVLGALNAEFPMAEHGGRFFTIWYGVYDFHDRKLRYSSAGHPPGLLFDGPRITELRETGALIGAEDHARYGLVEHVLPRETRLYLYTDGAVEIDGPAGQILTTSELAELIARVSPASGTSAEAVLSELRQRYRLEQFKDDVALLELSFP